MGTTEFLVLHRRAVRGDDDWAWGPPSGCRWPGEDIAVTARRELFEETGLDRDPSPSGGPDPDWPAFQIEIETNVPVVLSDEHDGLAWLLADEALVRVSPDVVRDQLRAVIAALAVV